MPSFVARCALPAIVFCLSTPALADRPPSPDEQQRIEQSLRNAGYASWEEIEFDDGLWEVDDAVAANGRIYDLKIDPRSYRIVRRTRDD